MPKLTIADLARLCSAEVEGPVRGEISGLAALDEAEPHEATFLADMRYRAGLDTTRAGCVLIGKETACERADLTLLRCSDPSAAFSKVIDLFAPPRPKPPAGIDPSASVHPTAHVHQDASIGPFCAVGPEARIEAGAILVSHVSVGAGCVVGVDSMLYPQVVLYPGVRMGARCTVHAGSVIGSDGFGFVPSANGWSKIHQGGGVRIEDDVDIGANCTVDCARFGDTVLARGAKIDNLVHIAHNVRIGEHSMLIAQSGVAGSSHLGRWVILAGQAGVSGHLELHDGARVGAGSKVLKDVAAGQVVFGAPAGPKAETLWAMAFLPRLRGEWKKLKQRIQTLENRT